MATDLNIDGQLKIPGRDLKWVSVRASGPGGQNVNKVATKVDLRFDVEATMALSEAVKARLRKLARGRTDSFGRIVVVSQVTRNRVRNLEDARRKLAILVRSALVPPKPRRATRPSASSKRRRLDDKRRQGIKKGRRRAQDDD